MSSGKDIIHCQKCGEINWAWMKVCWHCGVRTDESTQKTHEELRHLLEDVKDAFEARATLPDV